MKISQTLTELWGVQERKLHKKSTHKNNQRAITLKRKMESNSKNIQSSYGSCAWHIVSLCSRIVRSFNQIALTVFNLQSGQKIAFSYVTRGIIWKINMKELWFLCMTHRLNVLYKCMKFQWNTLKGYQVIEWTRNSIANDEREITPKYQKQSYGSFAWHIEDRAQKQLNFYRIIGPRGIIWTN